MRYVTVRYAGPTVRSNVDIQNVVTGTIRIENSRIFGVASGESTEDHGVYVKDSNVILSDTILTGETLTYTLVVTNAGPTLSADVVLTDPLPAGVVFLRSVPYYCEGQSPVTCKLGTVDVDEVVTVALGTHVASTARGLLVNTASVAGTARDRIPQNNIMTVTTSVDTEADLVVTKTSSSDPVTTGKSLVYTFTVMNNGPSQATDVSITDTLPS